MSWHGNRHSGGVNGTKFMRGYCPVCGRDSAGGNVERDRSRIMLKPHKRTDGKQQDGLCPGSRAIVPVDHDLTSKARSR